MEAGPPIASILANPDRGSVPLEVAFTAEMSGGFPPYSYAWDLNNDGIVDDTRPSFVQLYQTGGSYGVDLSVTDARGFTATASQTIEALVAPQVVASASPSEGTAPLDVAFSAVASDADGSIALYEWDFNGDGIVDQRSPSTASGAFRYETAGLYEARLIVTDNDGNASSDLVVISVGVAPELTASVSPLTGDAPLLVTFSASAEDPDGVVVRYDWDFEGDGIIDFTDPSTGDTTHTYDVGGVYPATINVYDDTGLFATRTFVVSVAGPPQALPRAYPTRGEAPLTVTFFSDGTDIDGSPEYYDWDFNGDGSRDIRLIASMNTAYTYTAPGTYDAALTVVDNDGLTGTATVQIEVLPAPGDGTTPTAEALARPSNGGTPLMTSLLGEGDDPDGTIVEYAWDFQADGTYDFVEPVSGSTAVGLSIDVGSYAAPVFLDMDGDGDRDLVIGNSNGQLLVYENRADSGSDAPVWAAGQTLRDETDTVIDVGSYAEPTVDDIDGDGDHDLLVGNSSGQIYLVENTGGSAAPSWVRRDRITDGTGSVIDVGSYANLLLLDHDADGDRDLLIGNSNGTLTLYLRGGTTQSPVWSPAGQLQNDTGAVIDVGSYAAPMLLPGAAADEDELSVGNSSGQIRRFLNIGTAASPSWQDGGLLQTPGGSTVDVGSYANPILFDLVTDGPVHLMVGDSDGRLDIVTEQTGGWAQTLSGYNAFDVGTYSSPALADLDSDADLDLLIGNSSGQLYLRSNLGTATSVAWFLAERLVDPTGAVIDIGSRAAPTLVDLDDDGDLDIVVGNSSGRLFLVRNDGDAATPSWAAGAQINYGNGSVIDVGSYAAPVAGDFDSDGDMDLLVGNSGGLVRYLRNDGDSSAPSWVSAGNLALASGGTLDVGSYAYPAVYDPDRNGTLDLLVGNSDGQMRHFDNLVPFDFSLVAAAGQLDGIDVGSYAAPAFADIDSDGDDDAFVGNSNGLMSLYPRYGQVLVEYTDAGTYTAVLRVTDNSGETATDDVMIEVLPPGSPSALGSATPVIGDVPLTVQFSGRGEDADGNIVEYAWDFDGDGTFDHSSATDGSASYTYTTAGIFDAVLRVTDDSGLTATDKVRIEAGFTITPSIGTVAFNPSAGEIGNIQTVIEGGEALVTIRILDGQGNLVRTLVNGALRGPGTYQDPWAGTDQNGQPVPDGPYYAVIEYTYNGETEVVDLREQAVFEEFTPTRSFSSSFNPYEGDPVTVSYQIPWAAEVSLYFWTRDDSRPGSSIAPVRTLFLRDARPPGSYSDVWDGFDDNGVVVEPGREYPVTLWLYRLPENAILVNGNRPEITAISVAPQYFNPSYNPYASGPAPSAVVSLETTKTATLQAEILNEQGLLVRRITRASRPAGANALTWDGRDGEGNLVAPGTYSIGVTAIDAIGNRSLSRYAAVTVRY